MFFNPLFLIIYLFNKTQIKIMKNVSKINVTIVYSTAFQILKLLKIISTNELLTSKLAFGEKTEKRIIIKIPAANNIEFSKINIRLLNTFLYIKNKLNKKILPYKLGIMINEVVPIITVIRFIIIHFFSIKIKNKANNEK